MTEQYAPVNERHFFRCEACCNVFALEGPRQAAAWNGRLIHECPRWAAEVKCDCGHGGRLEWMGRVERDALVKESDRCACDERCTSARGPKCNCECGGRNHGTHAVVRVREVQGIPTIETASAAKRAALAESWFAARDAASARIDADPTVQRMRAGEWISCRPDWDRARGLQAAFRKACKLKTIAARIAAAEKIAPDRAWHE